LVKNSNNKTGIHSCNPIFAALNQRRATMKFTVLIFTAVLLLSSCKDKKEAPAVNQADEKTAITKLMKDYEAAFKQSDWDKMLTFIHPGSFEFISKADFRKALETSFKGEGYSMKVDSMSIESIGNTRTVKDNRYSLVHIRMSADMLLDAMPDSSVCANMKNDTSVTYTDCRIDGHHIYFGLKDKLYAIYLAKDAKWYVLSLGDADSKKIVEKLIPEEVRSEM
jgi:hypothetical protein